jgi:predicted AlkP superfamily pyrophosphatase or phosphodiesterase
MAGKIHKTILINVAGLTPGFIGAATPHLSAWAARGKTAAIRAVTPAVTCSAQATYLTGRTPDRHGIVGNGWYFRDECEIKFWRQSNQLVQAAKIWETARRLDRSFTCANLFWWYNMYSSVDYSMTPRPIYPADGRKIPDLYPRPAALREEIQNRLGPFPLFDFWGPGTSIRSSQWIADAAIWTDLKYDPTLTLLYLPHLDYNLQRLGPSHPGIQKDLLEVDAVCGRLIRHFEARGAEIIFLSEYGVTEVSRPIHINRLLREEGLIAVRPELGRELLDAGASAAFAVADHQVAHVYINDPAQTKRVRQLLEKTPGIELILDESGKKNFNLNHPRAGDLIAISEADAWFTYYYWLDDRKAPDFAGTVDIHRKPGYDPVELFIDPKLFFPKLRIGLTLLKKALGFRTLLRVIPTDASLVKGSHGRVTDLPARGPLVMTRRADLLSVDSIDSSEVYDLILRHLSEEGAQREIATRTVGSA